jgi:hypothetical protein
MKWVEQRRARDLGHCLSEEFPHTMSAKCRCKIITFKIKNILKLFSLIVCKTGELFMGLL